MNEDLYAFESESGDNDGQKLPELPKPVWPDPEKWPSRSRGKGSKAEAGEAEADATPNHWHDDGTKNSGYPSGHKPGPSPPNGSPDPWGDPSFPGDWSAGTDGWDVPGQYGHQGGGGGGGGASSDSDSKGASSGWGSPHDSSGSDGWHYPGYDKSHSDGSGSAEFTYYPGHSRDDVRIAQWGEFVTVDPAMPDWPRKILRSVQVHSASISNGTMQVIVGFTVPVKASGETSYSIGGESSTPVPGSWYAATVYFVFTSPLSGQQPALALFRMRHDIVDMLHYAAVKIGQLRRIVELTDEENGALRIFLNSILNQCLTGTFPPGEQPPAGWNSRWTHYDLIDFFWLPEDPHHPHIWHAEPAIPSYEP